MKTLKMPYPVDMQWYLYVTMKAKTQLMRFCKPLVQGDVHTVGKPRQVHARRRHTVQNCNIANNQHCTFHLKQHLPEDTVFHLRQLEEREGEPASHQSGLWSSIVPWDGAACVCVWWVVVQGNATVQRPAKRCGGA